MNKTGYTSNLHLRLSPELYDRLQQDADRLGCTVSQAARLILSRRMPSQLSSNTENSALCRLVFIARKTRKDFREIAGDYHTFVTLVRECVNRDDVVHTEGMLAAVDTLTSLTLDLQASLDLLLQELKQNAVGGLLDETLYEHDPLQNEI